jgi:hypothetical protein
VFESAESVISWKLIRSQFQNRGNAQIILPDLDGTLAVIEKFMAKEIGSGSQKFLKVFAAMPHLSNEGSMGAA